MSASNRIAFSYWVFDISPLHLMCVHSSQESHEIALLLAVTDFPHVVHGNLIALVVLGPGSHSMSPQHSNSDSLMLIAVCFIGRRPLSDNVASWELLRLFLLRLPSKREIFLPAGPSAV